jgi:hypothetical protein
MLEFLDHQLIQRNANDEGGNPNCKKQKKDVFFKFRPELIFDIVEREIGDKDSGDLLSRVMAGKTFFPIINGVNVSEDFFPLERGVNHGLIKGLCGSIMAHLAGGITDLDDSPHILIIVRNDNPAGSIEDEDILHIRVLTHRLKDILHFILVLG